MISKTDKRDKEGRPHNRYVSILAGPKCMPCGLDQSILYSESSPSQIAIWCGSKTSTESNPVYSVNNKNPVKWL